MIIWVRAGRQLGDLAHHAALVLFSLGTGRIIVENDVGSVHRIRLSPLPAFHRGSDKPDHLILKCRIFQPILKHVYTIFKRSNTLILILKYDEVIWRNSSINHLPVFVVGHS